MGFTAKAKHVSKSAAESPARWTGLTKKDNVVTSPENIPDRMRRTNCLPNHFFQHTDIRGALVKDPRVWNLLLQHSQTSRHSLSPMNQDRPRKTGFQAGPGGRVVSTQEWVRSRAVPPQVLSPWRDSDKGLALGCWAPRPSPHCFLERARTAHCCLGSAEVRRPGLASHSRLCSRGRGAAVLTTCLCFLFAEGCRE